MSVTALSGSWLRALLATVAVLVGATAVGCGDDDSPDGAATPRPPSAEEVIEQEFPDDEEQNAAATVRRFYGVLGKTPKAQTAGNGCIFDGRMYNAGNCKDFRMQAMAPNVCRLLSKEAIDQNARDLYPHGLPEPPPPEEGGRAFGGLDRTDDAPDAEERSACVQGMGIFLRRVESDDGFKKAATARVVGVKLKGDTGKVKVKFFNGRTTTIDVVKQKGKWKFVRLAGKVGGSDEFGGADPTAVPPVLPIQ